MGTRYRPQESCAACFVTTTASDFATICVNHNCYRIIAEAIRLSLIKHGLKLLAYVIMPNHVHLVFWDPGGTISGFMRDFKRASAVRLRWEFDRSSPQIKAAFQRRYRGKKGYKIWMDRFDCVLVYSDPMIRIKIKYVLNNPVRKKLVSTIFDWPYSSAINYIDPSRAILPIELMDLDLN